MADEWVSNTIRTYNRFTSVNDIDNWILYESGNVNGMIYHDTPKDAETIRESNDTQMLQEKFTTILGAIANGKRMQASGSNSDCLIHSFLTCISNAYRTLDEEQKNAIGYLFRRLILPELPSELTADERMVLRIEFGGDSVDKFNDYNVIDDFNQLEPDNLASASYLSEITGRRLANRFKVNILFVFSNQQKYIHRHIHPTIPRMNTICIYGTGGHFEPIRFESGYVVQMENDVIVDLCNNVTKTEFGGDDIPLDVVLSRSKQIGEIEQKIETLDGYESIDPSKRDVYRLLYQANPQVTTVSELDEIYKAEQEAYQAIRKMDIEHSKKPKVSIVVEESLAKQIDSNSDKDALTILSILHPEITTIDALKQKLVEHKKDTRTYRSPVSIAPVIPLRPISPKFTRVIELIDFRIKRNRYEVTILHTNQSKIVDVQQAKQGAYQISNNGTIGNKYSAQVTLLNLAEPSVVRGGTRHKKKRFRSKTRRIKTTSNVKRR